VSSKQWAVKDIKEDDEMARLPFAENFRELIVYQKSRQLSRDIGVRAKM